MLPRGMVHRAAMLPDRFRLLKWRAFCRGLWVEATLAYSTGGKGRDEKQRYINDTQALDIP